MDKIKKTFYRKDFTATFNNEGGYFSLTGDISGSSGAVGERIADIDPEFKALESMHLANSLTGEPMYAVGNGCYHFKEKNLTALSDYWRTTPVKLAALFITEIETENSSYQKYSKNMNDEEKARVLKILEKMPEELRYSDLFPLKERDLSKEAVNQLLISNPTIWVNKTIESLAKIHASKPFDATNRLGDFLKKAGVINPFSVFKKEPIVNAEVLLLNVVPLLSKESTRTHHGYSDDLINFGKVIPLCLKAEEDKVISSIADAMKPQWLEEANNAMKVAQELPARTSQFSNDNVDSDSKKVALAKFVNCDTSEIVKNVDYEGVYEAQGKIYAILTPEESDAEFKEEIKQSLWAFNANFLEKFMPLKQKDILSIQESSCESSNDAFLALVGDKFDALCEETRKTDGVGHILNRYDSKEYSQEHDGQKFNLYLDFYPSTLTKKNKPSSKM